MTEDEVALLLDQMCTELTKEAQVKGAFQSSKLFEDRVRELTKIKLESHGKAIEAFQDQDFPDIVVDDWGIEVKHTRDDKWRTVANSVFEGHRGENVSRIYLVYAKMGGKPAVRWSKYEDAVVHVRTSHRPRYEVEIGAEGSLFDRIGVKYGEFRLLDETAKMKLIRGYARQRLKDGEQLWWLGDDPSNPPSLPIAARLYTHLSPAEKLRLRAQATLLCPEIVRSGRSKRKYDRAALFLLTYHGVIASQTRDLFSAGSVADPGNQRRGGHYLQRALVELQPAILQAAEDLEHALFEEYWGEGSPITRDERIKEWLRRADEQATDWVPSRELFKSK